MSPVNPRLRLVLVSNYSCARIARGHCDIAVERSTVMALKYCFFTFLLPVKSQLVSPGPLPNVTPVILLLKGEGAQASLELNSVKKSLRQRFKTKDIGPLHHFSGVKIAQDDHSGNIRMGQTSYTEMLQNHGKAACKAMSTPAKSRRQVSSLCRYRHDQQAYQVIIGSLLYLSATLIQTLHMLLNCVARF